MPIGPLILKSWEVTSFFNLQSILMYLLRLSKFHHCCLALPYILKVDDITDDGFGAIQTILMGVDRELIEAGLANGLDCCLLFVAAE